MKISVLADMLQTPSLRVRRISWWPTTTLLWMTAAFLIAAVCVAAVFLIFDHRERVSIALRLTARWSFLFFWLAYTMPAMARLFGARFAGLAGRSRDFGLAFASAHLTHITIIIWLFYKAPQSNGGMVFFWVAVVCTYLLAFLSLPQLHEMLGPTLWRSLRTVAMEYIALAFAGDFIVLPLQANGLGRYPLTYLPFAFMLIGGVGLRVAATVRQQPILQTGLADKQTNDRSASGLSRLSARCTVL
jgi:hypothetical protein